MVTEVNRMKNGRTLTLLMLIVCACIAPACIDPTPSDSDVPQAGDGGAVITWHSYEEGMAIATEQEKPVMVDVYANWCKWCKELDKVIYTDPDVIKLSDRFVCVKINMDKEHALARKYNPQGGVPAVVFLGSDGTVVHSLGGYPRGGPDAFVQEMMVALGKA